MSTILQELESQISGLKTAATKSNTGIVREAGDGVAKIEGLSDVMLNEMIEFPNGLFGLALNLEQDSVGSVVLGDYKGISEGDTVKTTGRILEVPVGAELLGRVVDALADQVADFRSFDRHETYPSSGVVSWRPWLPAVSVQRERCHQ